ncbi:MAG TPA: GNAT family protein [Streptosporangiaceae bacterium]
MTELRTERLALRPLQPEDREALVAHWAGAQVRRFLFDDKAPTPSQVTQFVTTSQQDFATSGYGLWSLRLIGSETVGGADLAWPRLVGGGLIGTIGLRTLETGDGDAIEIVYSLEPAYWRRGLVTEAAVAVLSHAFETVGLDRVLAEIDEGNSASVAVAERLGMRPVATVRGELGPMTHYAVMREEWLESRREKRD